MYHTPPPLSCNGQFNVLLFFLGDDFTMTKAVRGGGGLKVIFSFFYKFFTNIWKSEAIFFL